MEHTDMKEANPDFSAVVTIVQAFFKAFDERDIKCINELFTPTTKIVHHNGVVTTSQEIVSIIENTKDWWPRNRELSNFEIVSNANLAVLGLMNQVRFFLPEKEVEELYNETWIFEKVDRAWKPLRCHYSLVTAEQHSEDVK